ncbi:hypothetical protein DFH06DRAFT_687600 [Mycena polygramma]|nr:hypothetical protein DFH06DRAFT_687600 [Mycena polygramma]
MPCPPRQHRRASRHAHRRREDAQGASELPAHLNRRSLTLASMLPPLAMLRRPSKSAIVHTSIATVNAARRHRVLAAQTLRALSKEAENLGKGNQSLARRARARVPHMDAPIRFEAHATILRAEVEGFDLVLEDGLELEEDDEEDGVNDNDNSSNNNSSSKSLSNEGSASPVSPQREYRSSRRARAARVR